VCTQRKLITFQRTQSNEALHVMSSVLSTCSCADVVPVACSVCAGWRVTLHLWARLATRSLASIQMIFAFLSSFAIECTRELSEQWTMNLHGAQKVSATPFHQEASQTAAIPTGTPCSEPNAAIPS
jgi:hypothetical protein